MAIAAQLIGTESGTPAGSGAFTIQPSPNNTLIVNLQNCGNQVISLPSGNVTATQIVQTINSLLVGATAFEHNGSVGIISTILGANSNIVIGSSFTAATLGFLPPNNVASGSDAQGPIALTFEPPCYLVTGGIPAVITGDRFLTGATVSIGNLFSLQNVVVVSPQQMTGVIPAGQVGTYDVFVTNADTQTAIIEHGFTYVPLVAPSITGVVPAQGFISGETPVTISGTAFSLGMKFNFGTASATEVVIVSPTTATCKTPASTFGLGFVNVEGITLDGQAAVLEKGFEYVQAPVPTLLSITPSTGPLAGGIRVQVNGLNFLENTDVRFGVHSSTNVIFLSSQHLDVLLPAGDRLGPVDVILTHPDGGQDTLTNGFTYVNAPSTDTIIPNTGPASGSTPVTITGTDFQVGITVTFGGAQATNVLVMSPVDLTCETPPHAAGPVDVVLTNPDTQNHTFHNGFTYQPLSDAVQVSPSDLCNAQGLDNAVTGTLNGLNDCRDSAANTVTAINKRLSAFGPDIFLRADVANGDTKVTVSDSTGLALQDIALLFDDNTPAGEAFQIIDIEPELDGSSSFITKDPIQGNYTVAANGKVKRINVEASIYTDVLTVVQGLRTLDQLTAARDFLNAYVAFVDANKDPNL